MVLMQAIRQLLEEAKDTGELKDSIDLDNTSEIVFAIFTMYTIYWLNGLIGGSFFLAAFLTGMPLEQIGWHIVAGAIVLVAGFGLFAFRFIGGGDAKLLAVAALWLGTGQLMEFLVIMTLAGGLLAIAMKFWWWVKLETELRKLDGIKSRIKSSIDLPYGVAITAGALVAFRHSWWFETANIQLLS